MRRIMSYAKSHIYDMHAVVAGTIVFGLMQFIKKPIKKYTEGCVDRAIEKRPQLSSKRRMLVKRCNMILIVLTMVLSFAVFALLAAVSPVIHFSFQSAVMGGVYALFEYAIAEQFSFQ